MKHLISALCAFLLVTSAFAQKSTESDTAEVTTQPLVIGVKETPPFIIQNEDGEYSGVSIQLWDEVAQELGFQFEYRNLELPDLISSLENQTVDASINPLTVTSDRVRSFHFTQPFFITSLAIVTQKEEKNAVFSFVKNLFSPDFLKAVLLLFLVILIFGLLAWLFERKANPEEFETGLKGVWSGIWWSAVTMTTVGYGDKSPKSTGGRIVALIWMFTAIVIISGFTASIASSLTIDQLGAEIGGPDDLKNYKVLTIKGSTSEKFLSSKGIDHRALETPEDALDAIANGEAEALVYDSPILKYLAADDRWTDEVVVLPYTFNTQYYAFSVSKKHRNLVEEINPVLLKTIENVKWKATLNDYHLLD